jgi:hypothetical protein
MDKRYRFIKSVFALLTNFVPKLRQAEETEPNVPIENYLPY